MNLLVTAGPTWVKIDEVRVLTTVFTGRTGLFIAKSLAKRGHKVTLIVNSHCLGAIKEKNVKTVNFRYFGELKDALRCQLRKNKYSAVIHSAAVSDYILARPFEGKIASERRALVLRLRPAEKLIKMIRKLGGKSCLIQFKLEISRQNLLAKAYESLKRNNSDFVVANAYNDLRNGYRAFLIDKNKRVMAINTKKELVGKIEKAILVNAI